MLPADKIPINKLYICTILFVSPIAKHDIINRKEALLKRSLQLQALFKIAPTVLGELIVDYSQVAPVGGTGTSHAKQIYGSAVEQWQWEEIF